jgi:isopenicillin-N N-acyltransferase-like protein
MNRGLKVVFYSLLFVLLLIVLIFCYLRWGMQIETPVVMDKSVLEWKREVVNDSFFIVKNNWLRKNDAGWWEAYIEGDAFERGAALGMLNQEVLYVHEKIFVDRIKELVPSNDYLKFLKYFVKFFNRDIDKHIKAEYLQEIYGESHFVSDEFNFIAPPYERILNYHAAHDIGHALQNLALVGCTSFATWGTSSVDSQLLIARNFDFYVSDEFAKYKLLLFVKPDSGYRFVMLTWPGLLGCVSGMNEKGVTVTINAAKSDMPTAAATPISLLAREILQYAENIDQAYAIAQDRKTFVSETIMIGSDKDKSAALIEKSPTKTSIFYSNTNRLLCSNHYQSKAFDNDKNNLTNIDESASMYRFLRLNELLDTLKVVDPVSAVKILRDQRGKKNTNIGLGNEKALNQLIAMHSVVFQPSIRRFWISTPPFQLGKFLCYDFDSVFENAQKLKDASQIYNQQLTIAADPFLSTIEWTNFQKFKEVKNKIREHIKGKKLDLDVTSFIQLNPEYWEAYFWIGEFCASNKQLQEAIQYYNLSLTKEINDKNETRKILAKIEECKNKLK